MSENTQNQNPKQEQYSLNDDRRVKVLSPGALVAKRFFRNRLAVVGLSILVAMFLFSFVGGLVSPYGQDEQFFTYTQMSKEFVGVTRNDSMRFVVADGQNFGSIAQSKALEAVKKGNTEFNYKDVDYTVDILSDDFYVVYQGRDIMGYASRDLVNEADGAPKFSFDVKLAALTAMTAGEKEFAADGVDYSYSEEDKVVATVTYRFEEAKGTSLADYAKSLGGEGMIVDVNEDLAQATAQAAGMYLVICAGEDGFHSLTLSYPAEREAEFTLYAEFMRNSFVVSGQSNG